MSGFGKESSWAKENLMPMSMAPVNFREGRMKQVMPPAFEDTEPSFFDMEGDMEMDTVDGNPTEKHVDADFFNSKVAISVFQSPLFLLCQWWSWRN